MHVHEKSGTGIIPVGFWRFTFAENLRLQSSEFRHLLLAQDKNGRDARATYQKRGRAPPLDNYDTTS